MNTANDNRRPMSELGEMLFNMCNDMNRMQYSERVRGALGAVREADKTFIPVAFKRISDEAQP